MIIFAKSNMNGKLTCETLKKVRKQIADANGIPYEPAVCTHKGNCPGTCPACEAEVRYIERELTARKNEKKHLHIVGVAKDLLPSYESMAKHAAAVAIAAATSLSAMPTEVCAKKSSIATTEQVGKIVTVKGRVKDESGGLPGALVTVKGTDKRVEADDNGDFEIEAPIGSVLVVEFLGFEPEEIVVTKKKKKLQVKLGTAEADEIMGCAVSSYRFTRPNIPLIFDYYMLETESREVSADRVVKGLTSVTYPSTFSGQPGTGLQTVACGRSSLVGDDNLLLTFDGVAYDAIGRYTRNTFNTADIDHVTFSYAGTRLSRCRNTGKVMDIAMKKGGQSAEIQYNGSFSVSQFTKRYSMMNLPEYASYQTANQNENTYFLNTSLLGSGTDWQDKLFRTAVGHDHHLSFSNGNDKTRFYSSLGYTKQEGVIVGSDYERIGGRVSVGLEPNDWLEMGADVYVSHHASTEVANLPRLAGPTVSNYKGVDDNVLVQTLLQQPSDSPYNLDGSYAGPAKESGVTVNPVAEIGNSPLEYKETDVLGRAFLNLKLSKDVDWFTELSTNMTRSDERLFLPPYDYGTLSRPAEKASLREGQYNSNLSNLGTSISYNHRISRIHRVETSFSLGAESFDWNGQMVEGKGFSTSALPAMNLASEAHGDCYFDGNASMLTLHGVAQYFYRERYGLEFDGEYDGASYFGDERHWNFYPSVSARWNLSVYDFIDDIRYHSPFGVDLFSLEANYSESGNRPYSQLIYMSNSYRNNPNLEQERNTQYMLGLKMSFSIKDKSYLDFTAQVFRRENTNLMLDANAAGSENGLAKKDACFINAGAIKNTGFSVSLNGDIIRDSLLKKPISWSAALSFMHVRNEVTELGPFTAVTEKSAPLGGYSLFGNDVTVNRTVVGRAPGQFYGYKYEGLIQNEAELADYRAKTGRTAKVGDVRYSATKTYIGDPNPDFTFKFGTGFEWGPWTLNVQFSGVYGNDVYNMVRQRISEQTAANRNCNLSADCLDFARIAYDAKGNAYVANASTSMPRPDYDDASDAAASVISDRYVEDGSYLKIQTVSLTYSLPSKMTRLWHLDDFRLTASVENLHTFTKYSGYDPENPGSAIRQGVDEGRYPSPRTYRFSVSVKF